MKKLFAAVAALLLFSTPLLAQDQNTTPATDTANPEVKTTTSAPTEKKPKAHKPKQDEAGIKKSFGQVSEAWNAGDAQGVASFFTEDASLINPMGMEGHGLEGVKKVVEGEFAGPMKGTQQTFDDFSFVWVMPNLALVDCTGTVTGMKKADGTDADPMKVHVYGVIVNRGKGWKARSIRAYAFLMPPSMSDTSTSPAADSTPAASSTSDKKTDTKTDMKNTK